jgi:primary-amine oxidase
VESEEFKAKLEQHFGITDTSLLMVDIWSAGNYGEEEESTRRLTRPLVFLRDDPTDNGYAKPVESLRPVVDLNTMEVIRVEEYLTPQGAAYPLPPAQGNYAASRMAASEFRTGIKPLEITQPEGPSFSVNGNEVDWQNWKLVVGFNAREGLTLHHVRYGDRPIMYRASLSEMVVPYGDPSPSQARKNAFDVGEYGVGYCTNSLELGCDCLGHIHYFDGHLCTSKGEALTIKNAVCMHEEDFGINWKHTDRRLPDTPEVRRSRRLVISNVATIENYEYGYFWYLYQDGNIQFEVKMTGILSLGSLPEGENRPYGTVIAPSLYAPNHQHFFNMRLDMDVAGTNNNVYQVDVEGEEMGPENPYGNAFVAKKTLLKTESEAKAHLNLPTWRTWKFENPDVLNAMGDPVGYKFFPGDNCFPFAHPEAWWRKRAAFVDHHVWVTPNAEEEMYAAGMYPNQSTGEGDGLGVWTQQDRNVANTDSVFWYTFGHTHIPRNEDYPVMPIAHIGFLLKPNGFFDENPANDLPPSSKGAGASKQNCCGSNGN